MFFGPISIIENGGEWLAKYFARFSPVLMRVLAFFKRAGGLTGFGGAGGAWRTAAAEAAYCTSFYGTTEVVPFRSCGGHLKFVPAVASRA
jgi:hypothetical protein